MSVAPIYIAGMGIVSALGTGIAETGQALSAGRCGLGPLRLFGVNDPQLPVGAADLNDTPGNPLPRTHRLARMAAEEALTSSCQPPDAIILGTTTGGIPSTEALLQGCVTDSEAYRYHALGSVGDDLARRCGCRGPVITVSTACASGSVAIALAAAMLRRGQAKTVLAGGADALCRLTYFGFKSLQLIDPSGARPLDLDRRGMSVAEGAAFLLLTTEPQPGDAIQLLGAGLSCDAHHATTPLPEGQGARAAIQAALADAGLSAVDIDYINLHGTGTLDNDLAEARAVHAVFGDLPPLHSSVKGAMGHSLAAAGAIEAVVAAIAIKQGMVPANVGLIHVDPSLGLSPVPKPWRRSITRVLSNSFGFGGNNAALVIGRSQACPSTLRPKSPPPMTIKAGGCVTGAGHSQATWHRFASGQSCIGTLADQTLCQGLPPRAVRRLKRLPKMALALADHICRDLPAESMPRTISLGTAWGALCETHDFLQRLFETDQQFPSPTDFIGSVHNAPAGQIAMMLGAKGANVTTTGGDYSFEQALLAADLLTEASAGPTLLVGADEAHPVLSPLLDGSVRRAAVPADGGGALLLERSRTPVGPTITLLTYQEAPHPFEITGFISLLGGGEAVRQRYGVILAGIPAEYRATSEHQLDAFLSASGFRGPVIDFRRVVGEFGTASAVAAVLALQMIENDIVPGWFAGASEQPLEGRGVLLLGLGRRFSVVRIAPR